METIVQYIKNHKSKSIAIVDEVNRISYAEMFVEIEHLKNQILSNLKCTNARILLSGKNSTDFLLLLLSFLDTDMEIILMDPKSSIPEIEDLISSAQPNFIVSEDSLFEQQFITETKIKTTKSCFNIYKINEADVKSRNEKLSFCTSGSTGKQKVFGFTQAQLFSQFLNIANYLQFSETDQSLCPLTITHSHGLQISIPLLLNGGCVHYLSSENCKPDSIIKYVYANKITLLTGVPYQYNLMLNVDIGIKQPMKSLRYCFCGSAPMSKFLAYSFQEKFGVRLNQVYGLSEIGPICFNLDANDENYVSVGKVIPGIEYKVLDENGNTINENEEGELVVRADFMCDKYINNKTESQHTFIDGWLHTKDIVKLDEQKNFYIIGRKSNFINVAGCKIYPIEIEKVLLGIKGVKEAVVIGVDDDNKGQLIKAIITVFFIVDKESILVFCKKYLPIYKIPHIIKIVEELQHTSINKVDLSVYKNDNLTKKK